jgi:hypothetical protein
MSTHIRRSLVAVAALALGAGGASAQGYAVRTWGYYDPVPYPLSGGTYSYSVGGRPTVTVHDPWGRLVQMPLQPKVLYYDMPFATAQGWYRPTSIVVMPDARPRSYVAPARRDGPPPPKAALPPARSSVLPDVKSTGPIPTVPVNPPRAAPPGASLPPVPMVPELPTVPKVPGKDTGPTIPKLGPAPSK